jgi:hypothetical protein
MQFNVKNFCNCRRNSAKKKKKKKKPIIINFSKMNFPVIMFIKLHLHIYFNINNNIFYTH